MKQIKEVTNQEAMEIIDTRQPRGLFWTMEGNIYVAIDNLTGDAWTEDFTTKEECLEYLKESL